MQVTWSAECVCACLCLCICVCWWSYIKFVRVCISTLARSCSRLNAGAYRPGVPPPPAPSMCVWAAERQLGVKDRSHNNLPGCPLSDIQQNCSWLVFPPRASLPFCRKEHWVLTAINVYAIAECLKTTFNLMAEWMVLCSLWFEVFACFEV